MDQRKLLAGYDPKHITIGTLGGHSALDICHGAKKVGLKNVCIAREGRKKTYDHYFKTRGEGQRAKGCVDAVILVKEFEDVLKENIQEKLRKLNTIFIQSRYFWVYFNDYAKIENDFRIPIFGNRNYVKLEERDQPFNQYHLMKKAGIRTPKIFTNPSEIDRTVIVKASEPERRYERAFFLAHDRMSFETKGAELHVAGKVSSNWREAPIEEFIIGAPVNFNFFYSPLSEELEFMGTDIRRQTNLDGLLRLTVNEQQEVLRHTSVKMIETGHVAVTVKESLLEKAFDLGERFVQATKDFDGKGIIGPFALQGAVTAEAGKEDIVIFDVSLRIPGSPGTRFTPYSGYLHGENISYGERIAMEIKEAAVAGALEKIVT